MTLHESGLITGENSNSAKELGYALEQAKKPAKVKP